MYNDTTCTYVLHYYPLQVQPGKSLEQFNDLATHKIGFFRKKVTIANMLAFTKVIAIYTRMLVLILAIFCTS